MSNKIITIITLICFTLFSFTAAAQEPANNGKVTPVEKGERAPFAGVLLDQAASAKFLVESKYVKRELELNLRKEFDVKIADITLEKKFLEIEFNSLKEAHDQILDAKNKQIAELNQLIKESEETTEHWWFGAGAALAVILSITVFYAAVEISD